MREDAPEHVGRDGTERDSTVRLVPPVRPRKLAKVPFVELADGRLQGVVSSGSDTSRVYVSSITAGTHDYSCSTDNNRPCGGARGLMCKHLDSLVKEAVVQYGTGRVARYLKAHVQDGGDLLTVLSGTLDRAPAAGVFSRFLRHLTYLELPNSSAVRRGRPVKPCGWPFSALERAIIGRPCAGVRGPSRSPSVVVGGCMYATVRDCRCVIGQGWCGGRR